jgi:hypothetical protein
VQYEATHTLLTTLWLSEARDSLGDALKRVVAIVADDYAHDVIDHPEDAAWGFFDIGEKPLTDAAIAELDPCLQVKPLEPTKISSANKAPSTFSRLLSRGQDLLSSVGWRRAVRRAALNRQSRAARRWAARRRPARQPRRQSI